MILSHKFQESYPKFFRIYKPEFTKSSENNGNPLMIVAKKVRALGVYL